MVDFMPPSVIGEGRYSVSLMALDGENMSILTRTVDAAGGWRCEFPLVLPGRHQVSANYSPSQLELQDGGREQRLGAFATVTVTPGERSRLVLK